MDQWKKAPYAVLGTGGLAIEKATELYGKASSFGRKAGRGEDLVKRIQRSKTARRAVDGGKQASRQLKGAVTSIRKAAGLEEKGSTRKAS
jgi:hypothetical protein